MTIIDAEGTCFEYVDSLDAAGAVAKWFPKDDGSALSLAKGVDTRLAIFVEICHRMQDFLVFWFGSRSRTLGSWIEK